MKLPKEFTLVEIATLIGGKVEAASPDAALTKIGAVAINPLKAGPGDLALFFDTKLVKHIGETKASAVLVEDGTKSALPAVVVPRALVALRKMLSFAQPKRFVPAPGIHETAVIDSSAKLGSDIAVGPNVVIGPNTVIGDRTKIMANTVIGGEVKIGADCLFHPGCLIADYVQIGNRVIFQQGASVGSDGFSYVTERPSNMELRMAGINKLNKDANPPLKIPNIGTVIIEDDVEIGSNTTIDRATMGATIIGQATKIDNLVMIAHNVKIGRECLIVSGSAIAGSCTLGDRVVVAGQAGFKDHLKIGDDVIVQGQAGIMTDLADAEVACGTPAIRARDFMVQVAHWRKQPKLASEVKALQKRLTELEKLLLEKNMTAKV